MTDIGKFTEPKNKMVPLLPWEQWPSKFEVQKNDSLVLIIEIVYLKLIFFFNGWLFISVNYFYWSHAKLF